ncbi:MAG: hypothetical protein WC836_14295 [Desulfobacula sp.]
MSEKNLSIRREEYEEKWLKNILKEKKKKRRIYTFRPGSRMHFQVGPDSADWRPIHIASVGAGGPYS